MNRRAIKSIAIGFAGLGLLSACSGGTEVKTEINIEDPFKTACQEYFLEGLEGEFYDKSKPEMVTRCECMHASFDAELKDEDIIFFTETFKYKDSDTLGETMVERYGEEKFEAIGEMIVDCINP